MGWRALRRVEQVIREESDTAGGQELHMPSLHPTEVWEESGRREAMGDILFALHDRRQRDLVLGPTHEEIIVGLFKSVVQSYRDLPLMPTDRNSGRARPGSLIRLREFACTTSTASTPTGKGSASLPEKRQCYEHLQPLWRADRRSGRFRRHRRKECGSSCLTEAGRQALICQTAAMPRTQRRQSSRRRLEPEPLPVEEVSTPGSPPLTTGPLPRRPPGKHLGVFYVADRRPVFVAIRGELPVNETKLRNALRHRPHLMDAVEARDAGRSRVRVADRLRSYVIADDSAPGSPNLVAGANKPDTHLRNVNYERDWKADVVTDIALARGGEPCSQCGGGLEIKRGIEVGHIFKLGTFYSEKLGATFLAPDGSTKPAIMGTYGIGVERLLATVIEANHDDKDHPVYERRALPGLPRA
jgi:prolyl-tRNA synthetase